jgi:hypothetical protein
MKQIEQRSASRAAAALADRGVRVARDGGRRRHLETHLDELIASAS